MKVNKYILLFCLLACSWNICGQNSCFHIEGTVDSKYNGALVTLFTITGNVIRSVDSTYVENGCFGFVGPEYLYEKSIISLGNYPDTVLSAELYLESGPIKVELKHNSVVCSPLTLEYQQFLDSCAEYRRQISVALKNKEDVEDMELKLCEYKYRFKKKHIFIMGWDVDYFFGKQTIFMILILMNCMRCYPTEINVVVMLNQNIKLERKG